MPDASAAYRHYRSGSGSTLTINYEKAYQQDSVIKRYINNLFSIAESQIESLRKKTGKTNFKVTSDLYPIPNGATVNWQRTIGAHYVWASADVNYSSHKYTIHITVHMKDRYNFNRGMSDITSGTPDEVNGRFAILGWAKSFFTVGQLSRTITWTEGNISKTAKVTAGGGR